jgi:predicted aldo/keto reductase-like oxidoreductase
MKKQNQSSRRDFLKKSLAGAAGLAVLPSLDSVHSQGKEKITATVIYRTLGRTGMRVPVISMGSSSNEYLIRAALDKGIVHFDTAYIYGNGTDEVAFGKALQGRDRSSFIIASKIVGLRDPQTGLPPNQLKPADFKANFRREVETSLKRLKLDYLDILYLQAVDDARFLNYNMVRDIMQELKNEGKIRFLGVATHRSNIIYPVVDEKIYDVILTTYNFRQQQREVVEEAIDYAVNAGCGIVCMKAMAGVYWDRERKQPINSRGAIKWVLQNENIHTVIAGIANFKQLDEDIAIMADLQITQEEKEALRLGSKLNLPGLYCDQCESCSLQCPYHLDVPRIMRGYMYAYGYKNPAKAVDVLQHIDLTNPACINCSSCKINCPMHFDIKNKILDIARIKQVPAEFII